MWSLPAIIYIFLSVETFRKFILFSYFSLVVFSDLKLLSDPYNEYITVVQFFLSLIVLKYFYQFLVKNKYFRIKSKPILIAISGDSGVGKSSISNILKSYFGENNTSTIEVDNYHKYERDNEIWKTKTHLNPTVNNLSLFKKQLTEIVYGNIETIREYNHLSGKFDESKILKKNDFIIIEGLHSLFMKSFNKIYNLKIFIDLEKTLKDEFKIKRDLDRNKSIDEINKQIKSRENDYKEYILPQKYNSDLSINTLALSGEEITIEVNLSTEYLDELIEILNKHRSQIISAELNQDLAKLVFKTNRKNNELINHLTKELINLKDDLFIFENNEISLKSSLILYFLSKKLDFL